MIGFVGNMEGGYGTRDRYLARIFAGTFTPMSKFAIYANANNVNAGQAPQVDTDWRPETMPTGTKKTIQGESNTHSTQKAQNGRSTPGQTPPE